jgi:hypothetical protein
VAELEADADHLDLRQSALIFDMNFLLIGGVLRADQIDSCSFLLAKAGTIQFLIHQFRRTHL